MGEEERENACRVTEAATWGGSRGIGGLLGTPQVTDDTVVVALTRVGKVTGDREFIRA